MQQLIIDIMDKFGYIGIMFLIALENIFPPIPSEVILTFGGVMTISTSMTILGVIIFSTLGSILGALVLYGVGYLLSRERLEKLVSGKVGRILHFKKDDVAKSESWFIKYGKLTVFFCRFIPIIRSLISIPAGMTKMNMCVFLILTTTGTLIWNTVLVTLGAAFATSWEKIAHFVDTYSNITLIVLIAIFLIACYLFYRFRIAKKKKIYKFKKLKEFLGGTGKWQ